MNVSSKVSLSRPCGDRSTRLSLVLCVVGLVAQFATSGVIGQDDRAHARVLVQTTLTAGLRHHDAKAVWENMSEGDSLVLVREPANEHDPNAVRVDWRDHTLGYLPRSENADVARQLDRGQPLRARIVRLTRYRNHHRKLEIELYLEL